MSRHWEECCNILQSQSIMAGTTMVLVVSIMTMDNTKCILPLSTTILNMGYHNTLHMCVLFILNSICMTRNGFPSLGFLISFWLNVRHMKQLMCLWEKLIQVEFLKPYEKGMLDKSIMLWQVVLKPIWSKRVNEQIECQLVRRSTIRIRRIWSFLREGCFWRRCRLRFECPEGKTED